MATDIKRIMEQLLGGGGLGSLGGLLGGTQRTQAQPGMARGAGNPSAAGGLTDLFGSGGSGGGIGDILGKLRPPMGGAGQAAAMGGLLGTVLGGRGGGGGLFRVGGMALLGLLAHRAFGQWKQQQGESEPAPQDFAQLDAPDSQGGPFGLSVLRAMVAAARSDGTLDSQEHQRIFAEAERLSLSADEKAEIFSVLETTPDPSAIARLAKTDAQKAELYLASAMVLGGADNASERVYLDVLSSALNLPGQLRMKLDAQLQEAAAATKAPG